MDESPDSPFLRDRSPRGIGLERGYSRVGFARLNVGCIEYTLVAGKGEKVSEEALELGLVEMELDESEIPALG